MHLGFNLINYLKKYAREVTVCFETRQYYINSACKPVWVYACDILPRFNVSSRVRRLPNSSA